MINVFKILGVHCFKVKILFGWRTFLILFDVMPYEIHVFTTGTDLWCASQSNTDDKS